MALGSLNKKKEDDKPLAKHAGYFADADGNIYDTGQITLKKALQHLLKNTTIGTTAGALGGAGLGALGAKLSDKSVIEGAKYGAGIGGTLGGSVGAITGTKNPLIPVGKIDYKKTIKKQTEKKSGITGGALGLMAGTAVAPFTGLAGGLVGGTGGYAAGAGLGALKGLVEGILKGKLKNINPQVLDKVGGKYKPVEAIEDIIRRNTQKGGKIGLGAGMLGGTTLGAYYPIHKGIQAGSGLEDIGIAKQRVNNE